MSLSNYISKKGPLIYLNPDSLKELVDLTRGLSEKLQGKSKILVRGTVVSRRLENEFERSSNIACFSPSYNAIFGYTITEGWTNEKEDSKELIRRVEHSQARRILKILEIPRTKYDEENSRYTLVKLENIMSTPAPPELPKKPSRREPQLSYQII